MSYKVIVELEYENKPNVENVLEYIKELGTDLDYKLIDNSKKGEINDYQMSGV